MQLTARLEPHWCLAATFMSVQVLKKKVEVLVLVRVTVDIGHKAHRAQGPYDSAARDSFLKESRAANS